MNKLISFAREGALLVIRSDLATALVTGPDRCTWLNALLTHDVATLKPGGALNALALNKKGRVLTEAWVVASPDRLLLAIDAATQPALLEHFDHYLVMEDAEIAAAVEPMTWVTAYGPLAAQAAEDFKRTPGFVSGSFSHFGCPSVMFALPAPQAAALLATRSDPPVDRIAIASLEQFDQVRVDLGIMRYGVEFNDSTYPEEAGLDGHAISFNKGCYLGQEVVVKMKSRGHPSKKVVRLVAPGDVPFAVGDAVSNAAGQGTGAIACCHASCALPGHVAAFATVRMPDAPLGTLLHVAGRDATVVAVQGLIG